MPVRKMFFRLSIPNVMSTLFSTVYIIADGIFVGRYTGSSALAAGEEEKADRLFPHCS